MQWQVNEILNEIKSLGVSKHEAKEQARIEGARGSHRIGQKTGIYSLRTIDSYRQVWLNFANFAKENAGLKDLSKTTAEVVKSYLQSRIDENIAHKTFQLEKSALNKLETALNRYSKSHNLNKTYDFKLNENFNRQFHKNMQHSDVRAYDIKSVEKLLNIDNKVVNITLRCAFSAGLRKSEILKLTENNLKSGSIEIIGAKGGKDRIVSVISDKSLISDIKAFLKDNNIEKIGSLITGSKINYEISKATGNSGSIHRLRHNYVINTLKFFENKEFSHIEAKHYTSLQVGHNRTEIIEGVYSK